MERKGAPRYSPPTPSRSSADERHRKRLMHSKLTIQRKRHDKKVRVARVGIDIAASSTP
jgi:hypothetical protein